MSMSDRDGFIWQDGKLVPWRETNYLMFYKWHLLKKTSINEINIEFVSYCNLRCKLCSLDHETRNVRMSAQTLKHFFEDLLSDKRFRSVQTIHLYNAGEVLLHPKLEEMLAIIKDYKQEAQKTGSIFQKLRCLQMPLFLTKKIRTSLSIRVCSTIFVLVWMEAIKKNLKRCVYVQSGIRL